MPGQIEKNLRIAGFMLWIAGGKVLSPEQQKELDKWVSASSDNAEIFHSFFCSEQLTDRFCRFIDIKTNDERMEDLLKHAEHIKRRDNRAKHIRKIRWGRRLKEVLLFEFACIGCAVLSFFVLYALEEVAPPEISTVNRLNDLAPPAVQAVAVRNHRHVVLHAHDRRLFPDRQNKIMLEPVLLFTAADKVYNDVLPDGTRFWLGTGSEITFPTLFTDMQREVQVNGEVYFEALAGNDKRPFIIRTTTGMTLKTDGRFSFSISSRPEQQRSRINLARGTVVAVCSGKEKFLQAGNQMLVSGGNNISISFRGIDKATELKDHRFVFSGALTSLMKDIGRWYKVEIVYEENFRDIYVDKTFSRNQTLAQLLAILQHDYCGIFTIQGTRVYVRSFI